VCLEPQGLQATVEWETPELVERLEQQAQLARRECLAPLVGQAPQVTLVLLAPWVVPDHPRGLLGQRGPQVHQGR
jgi:hypothetical protein